ncbi:MAG: DUF624 domain-containing protein [Eubacterium sp.]|nr:DUF624 domain-containing protein [Eubacterium sp.]
MKKFFDIDSPIYKLMTTIMNFAVLNICWLLGSLLIITIGPASVAACDVGLKMVDNEEGYIFRQFWKAFKSNLKQGIPLGIITFAAFYAVYLDFQIVNALENPSIFLIMGGILSGAIFVTGLIYAYPLTARYENTLPKIIKNSFRISTKYFIRTLLLIICLVVEILAFMWNETMIFIAVIIGPASIVLTICAFAKPIFKKLEKAEKSGE